MELMNSIFLKSSALALIHPIFSLYVSEYPDECTALSMLSPVLKLACFLKAKYDQATDFVDQISVIKGNKRYEAAFNAAKLQYKSIHAIE
ncbi:unnamed protein product, partial [Rotaria sp. Silwood2]